VHDVFEPTRLVVEACDLAPPTHGIKPIITKFWKNVPIETFIKGGNQIRGTPGFQKAPSPPPLTCQSQNIDTVRTILTILKKLGLEVSISCGGPPGGVVKVLFGIPACPAEFDPPPLVKVSMNAFPDVV
jgi:hypothetical protein